MRFVVRLAWDKARVLSEGVTALGPRLHSVRGREWRELIVLFAPAVHPVASIEPRDVGGATPRELAGGEVVGLLDEVGLTWTTTQLGAIDLQLTAERIGSAGEALALFDGVDGREPVDDRHALDQWDGTGPQADDPVR